MNKEKSEIIIVLDRSGSMATIKNDVEGGLKSFIEKQRLDPGECLVSLFQFDTEYETVFQALAIKDVPNIVVLPRGGTALYDAVGNTINAVGKRLKNTLENNRPGLVVVVIITDGEENSSREFSGEKISEMIKHQTEKYKWQFVFLAANQDAFVTGATMGVMRSSTMTYGANFSGISSTYSTLSSNISASKSAMYNAGVVKEVAFTEKERGDAMGDENPLSKGNPLGNTTPVVSK